jgi:trans-2-enoyl-CoA reductase
MGKKELNPADAYRREMKKKVIYILINTVGLSCDLCLYVAISPQEIKKNKIRRDQIREVHSMLNNPDKIEEEVRVDWLASLASSNAS